MRKVWSLALLQLLNWGLENFIRQQNQNSNPVPSTCKVLDFLPLGDLRSLCLSLLLSFIIYKQGHWTLVRGFQTHFSHEALSSDGILHWILVCEFLVVVCGIYFPNQGSNQGPLHWVCGVLAVGPPGKFLWYILYSCWHLYEFFCGCYSLHKVSESHIEHKAGRLETES